MQQLQSADEHPLYEQLKSILKAEIEKGTYKRGERIPTEAELCQIYSVSRNTVRNALNELTKENLLVRRQGKGTFVTRQKVVRPISRTPLTRSFTQMCREIGCVPGAKIIKSVIEDATEEDASELGIGEDEKVIVIERIRYTDKIPVSVEISRFPERFSFLLEENLNDCSMFEVINEKYDIHFSTEHMMLELVFATYAMAHYLGLSTGYPLLYISSLQVDTHGMPSHRSLQYIAGDKFRFSLY